MAMTDGAVSSAEFYDAIAGQYAVISEPRLPYLNMVDALVVFRAAGLNPQSYLDVGCGDGRRTLRIAQALGVKSVLGIDESPQMLAQATGISAKQLSVVELDTKDEYDMVTALWNVFGHMSAPDRVTALGQIAYSMTSGARLFLDVNNRYNARAYGQKIVDTNLAADRNGANSGDVVASFEVDNRTVSTVGHVFCPTEIEAMLENCPELRIVYKAFVDYKTGEIVGSEFEGQVFYEIKKAA